MLVWRGITTEPRARLATGTLREMASRGRFGVVVVVEPEASPPGADTRPMFAKAMRDCGDQNAGVAYVIPADGFRGAAIRSAVTGLSLLAREPYPTKVFRSLPEATAWLAPRVSPEMAALSLQVAVGAVRLAMPAH